MHRSQYPSVSRRQFLATTAAGAATALAAPAIHAANKARSQAVIGEGEHRYEVIHAWPQLPDKFSWQTTHNVAVDRANNLYVMHEGHANKPDHPSIFVFDPEGKYIRSFGSQYQGGGHGIEVRKEGNEEFLYVCGYQQVKAFSKMDLKGEVVWHKHAPMDSGVYAKGEDTDPKKIWGRNRFMPTNFAFLPDGDFFLVDGYGSYYIHRYDKDGNWKSHFGGPGKGDGKFNLPHGIWIDSRSASAAKIVVCDRAHHTVQYRTLDGEHIETLTGYGLPANVDTYEDLMLVPELVARLTIHGKDNKVVAQLGSDVERISGRGGGGIRGNEGLWQDGRFVHPHDACFDNDGNILVAEWVATGRVSKLRRLS
ncbi:MAG: twin-arginine translocation signal domain-containing protein [Pirellulales bacterium]